MAEVTMYTTPVCPYCTRAKQLLQRKGVTDYKEINIAFDPALRAEMQQKSGGRQSVPQIIIGDTHVGGFDDLYALEKEGKLDDILAA